MKKNTQSIILLFCILWILFFAVTHPIWQEKPTLQKLQSQFTGEFPQKNIFLEWNALFHRILGMREMHGVAMVGQNAYIQEENIEDMPYKLEVLQTLQAESKEFQLIILPTLLSGNAEAIAPYQYTTPYAQLTQLMQEAKALGMQVLDLSTFKKELPPTERFFKSDHHWLPAFALQTALPIAEHIAATLHIPLQKEHFAPSAYHVQNYPKIFLGTAGKRTGRLFTGLDDFKLLSPKFETKFTVESPFATTTQTGTFEEVFIKPNYLEYDYYELSPYKAYFGDVIKNVKITNHLANNNKKVLYIIDSYSLPLMAFLANVAQESYVYDFRYSNANIAEEIKRIQPDLVVTQFSHFAFAFDFKDYFGVNHE